jgi:hypothetical protein
MAAEPEGAQGSLILHRSFSSCPTTFPYIQKDHHKGQQALAGEGQEIDLGFGHMGFTHSSLCLISQLL